MSMESVTGVLVVLVICQVLLCLYAQPHSLMFNRDLGGGVMRVNGGQTITFQCEAAGRPVPTIQWLHDGRRITQEASHSYLDDAAFFERKPHDQNVDALQLGNTAGRLRIFCVTHAHAGHYACVAQTPTERIVSTAILEVALLANIYMWEMQRLEYEGLDVQLFCRASGFPLPRMTWYDRNNDVITDTHDQYKVLKNGDLIIKNISWAKHVGLYRCAALNVFGKDATEGILVSGKTLKYDSWLEYVINGRDLHLATLTTGYNPLKRCSHLSAIAPRRLKIHQKL
ncbi:hypothetical protein LSH36_361g05002 [Paralvinella palmiformis]|uniref:Ig-like domain-containing protein n=1 Tax=Paralvinella palmiformis TaxID=53620 RepID=A0AAD9MZG2_9ANNE|nr:hypothetical protein LSH36_361g05002 [Paralvinella palmiformis]